MTQRLNQAIAAQNQASHPGSSVWVSASAGTGKTKVLTDRLLRLLLEGNQPHRILCLTFTKAAAAEMANRLHSVLSRWATLEEPDLCLEIQKLNMNPETGEILGRARRLFTHVLDTPGGLKVQTIHGFCQSLLKRFPLEAGITPHFEILEEQEANKLMHQAHLQFLEAENKSPLQEEALGIVAQRYDMATLSVLLGAVVKRPPFQVPDHLDETEVDYRHGLDEATLTWAAEILKEGKATDQRRGHLIWEALQTGLMGEADFLVYASAYLTQKNELRKTLCTADLGRRYPELEGLLLREAERVQGVLEALHTQKINQFTASLKIIAGDIIHHYQTLKEQKSCLDYDDLITKTAALLEKPDLAPWVLYKLDGGLDHILVDEAQDTSPQQWAIITALAEEFFHNAGEDLERTLFVVGDTKQSIYSFQGADPEAFAKVRHKFSTFSQDMKRPWSVVDLNTSFRSTEAVLRVVDHVFSEDRVKGALLLDTPSLKHHAFREGQGGKVEVWPLVLPQKEEESAIWDVPVQEYTFQKDPEQQVAENISQRIATMLETQESLPSKGRPIRPSDILILVRRRGSFVPKLIRALKHHAIPVAGSDRMRLTEQLVVKDLIALSEFLLLTTDDLSLAAALKSPLFNLNDEDLIDLCPERTGSLWQALLTSPSHKNTVETLKTLLNLRGHVRPYELYTYILSTLEGRRDFVRRLGPDCLDPLDEFMNQVLAFEQTHTPTLQGFIEYMLTSNRDIKRDFDQGERGELRVMTVHGAKGLQAPIVILPDTTSVPNKPEKLLFSDEDFTWSPPQALDTVHTKALKAKAHAKALDEYWRLLYVAMTRAEDQLYVCGWQSPQTPEDGNWYTAIHASLENLGSYKSDTESWVYEEPQRVPLREVPFEEPRVKGSSQPDWISKKVVTEGGGIRWENPSHLEEDYGGRRSVIGGEKTASHTPDYGAQRGTLIHKILERVPDCAELEKLVEVLGQDVSAAQRLEIKTHASRVLESPGFRAISGSDSHGEVPVIGSFQGAYYSGQIDRLVVEDNRLLVVDYKTTPYPARSLGEVPSAYIKQLEIYKGLLQPLYPGKTIVTALFWTESCTLMTLEEAQEIAA